MADKKLHSAIRHVGTDGRKYFDPAFITGVCADIHAQNKTVQQFADELGIHKTTIYAWLKRTSPVRRLRVTVHRAEGKIVAEPGSLLEKAMKVSPPSPQAELQAKLKQEVDLAIALIHGRVTPEAVREALGKNGTGKFMHTSWIGGVFTRAIRAGWEVRP